MTEEDALLAALEHLADELGRPPTSRDVREHGEYTVGMYRSAFGSWSNALEAAGFDAHRSGTKYEKDELLEKLRRLAAELDHPPTIEELREDGKYSLSPYQDRFGSWTNALAEAGLEDDKEPPTSDEAALDELRRLAGELGRTPTKRELREHGRYSESVYRDRFGSWSSGLETAGMEPRSGGSRISDEDLLAELQRLSKEHQNPPTVRILREHGEYSLPTYRDRFGSWHQALEAAGIESEPARFSDESLLEELRQLADELGHAPTLQEFRDYSDHSATTYYERFGSWRQSLQEAGFDDRPPQQAIPREDLIAELKRLADDLDKVPTQSEMNEQGAYHRDTYVRRLGSWDAALEAAGIVCEEPE